MRFWPRRSSLATAARGAVWHLLLFGVASLPLAAHAQLQFTEVMSDPGGDDGLWEWVEVRNTSAAAVNLNGWVFDDDDDSTFNAMAGANIKASNGNTIVPALGVAVLYPGSQLENMPARFTSAWGAGITLIPVDNFTSLTATDSIGLWPSYAAYTADTIPMVTMSPRRTFASAAVTLNYATGFPTLRNKHSIAWKGTGSPSDGLQWVESVAGADGAPGPFHEVTSTQTTIESAPINDTADLANPGIVPSGPARSGLLVTEIMFAPASPVATAVWTSADFEWVEIYNNTGAAIDFGATPYVFDDFAGSDVEENIESGSLAAGEAGILFNSDMLTTDQMATMWGAGKNYIPVTSWPALNNSGGDTIALWDDVDDYNAEGEDGDDHRLHANAVASVVYNTSTMQGWPSQTTGRSIFLNNLQADPNVGASWTKSGATADHLGSANAAQLNELAIDHPGGDIGSPGYVPGSASASLLGDYNGDQVVNAADYTVWRNSLGGSSLLNDPTPGNVGIEDYNYWKSHFGATLSGSGGIATVPEPASGVLLLLAAICVRARRFSCRRGRRALRSPLRFVRP